MKEIKFRAWDKNKERMRKVVRLHWLYGKSPLSFINGWHSYDWQLMQYTGLKDKNGKEIYEGDIVIDDDEYLYIVTWHNEHSSFVLSHDFNDLDDYDGSIFEVRKVVGNIFEDPELIMEFLKECE